MKTQKNYFINGMYDELTKQKYKPGMYLEKGQLSRFVPKERMF